MNLQNSKDRDGIFGGLTRERDMMPEYRNRRSVWTVATKPYQGAHFATFPPGLIEPCILAGAPTGGVVLDPFLGSGTTAAVASGLRRRYT
jgi:DNA modification methylase